MYQKREKCLVIDRFSLICLFSKVAGRPAFRFERHLFPFIRSLVSAGADVILSHRQPFNSEASLARTTTIKNYSEYFLAWLKGFGVRRCQCQQPTFTNFNNRLIFLVSLIFDAKQSSSIRKEKIFFFVLFCSGRRQNDN